MPPTITSKAELALVGRREPTPDGAHHEKDPRIRGSDCHRIVGGLSSLVRSVDGLVRNESYKGFVTELVAYGTSGAQSEF